MNFLPGVSVKPKNLMENSYKKPLSGYEEGKITSSGSEKLETSLHIQNNHLILDFGTECISWVALKKEQAEQLADLLLTMSQQLK